MILSICLPIQDIQWNLLDSVVVGLGLIDTVMGFIIDNGDNDKNNNDTHIDNSKHNTIIIMIVFALFCYYYYY